MGGFEVKFYKTTDGKCPVLDFLDNLDTKLRAKTLKMIELLEEFGHDLRLPYSSHLDESIFELRTIQGNNITRVLYFFCIDQKIILTNGLVKKTQKTPSDEIERAKKYRKDFLRRKEYSCE